MKSIPVLLAAALLSFAAPVHAEAAPPAWQGVWRGTLGPSKIQACLQHEDYRDFGAYYYMRHLTIIGLDTPDAKAKAKPGAAPVWIEDSAQPDKAPAWHFSTVTRDRVIGTWTGGGKTLPIDLTRVPAGDGETCGSAEFSAPRFTQPVVTTQPAKLHGVAYTRVIADVGKQFTDSGAETFQLTGTTPAIKKINAELYRIIPTGRDNAPYFDCSMSALENGYDGGSMSVITPTTILPSWLALEDWESGTCGGPYPYTSIAYQTWDLRTGKTVNLYDWFNASALTQTTENAGTENAYTMVTFTAPFRKMIDAGYPRHDEDCVEVEQSNETWAAHLTSDGIAFTPELPHVVQACTEDVVIPFAKLAPYLSPAGKTGVASFTAELKTLK